MKKTPFKLMACSDCCSGYFDWASLLTAFSSSRNTCSIVWVYSQQKMNC